MAHEQSSQNSSAIDRLNRIKARYKQPATETEDVIFSKSSTNVAEMEPSVMAKNTSEAIDTLDTLDLDAVDNNEHQDSSSSTQIDVTQAESSVVEERVVIVDPQCEPELSIRPISDDPSSLIYRKISVQEDAIFRNSDSDAESSPMHDRANSTLVSVMESSDEITDEITAETIDDAGTDVAFEQNSLFNYDQPLTLEERVEIEKKKELVVQDALRDNPFAVGHWRLGVIPKGDELETGRIHCLYYVETLSNECFSGTFVFDSNQPYRLLSQTSSISGLFQNIILLQSRSSKSAQLVEGKPVSILEVCLDNNTAKPFYRELVELIDKIATQDLDVFKQQKKPFFDHDSAVDAVPLKRNKAKTDTKSDEPQSDAQSSNISQNDNNHLSGKNHYKTNERETGGSKSVRRMALATGIVTAMVLYLGADWYKNSDGGILNIIYSTINGHHSELSQNKLDAEKEKLWLPQ